MGEDNFGGFKVEEDMAGKRSWGYVEMGSFQRAVRRDRRNLT
jgi:hypothetical protein